MRRSTARRTEDEQQSPDADDQGQRVGLWEVGDERAELVEDAPGRAGDAQQLGQLA